jgi:YD repeat-containing protein
VTPLATLASLVPLASGLSSNWRTTYDRNLEFLSATSVVAERPDGQRLTFTLTGSIWQPDTDVDYTLTNSGNEWTLTDPNDTVETYSTAIVLPELSVTNYAGLTSIRTRNGYTRTLNYNGFQLASVTDSYNRTLSFTYASGFLQTVTTPDGLEISYQYNQAALPSGSGNRLIKVSYSTVPATSQTYLYENAVLPWALTGIIDQNGNRYATWTYDASARELSSQHGTGANLVTITYDDTTGNRTLTGPLGSSDLYKFTYLQGIPKLTEVDRAATATTAAATELFTYDANGYLASQTDWNGNQTTYVNDVHGQPTSINEAVRTAVARTTTITYDTTFVHLPDTIATPGLTTGFTYDASGNPLTTTLTDTTTTTVPYSTNGQTRTWTNTWANFLLASTKGPRTDVAELTTFTYDASGALTAITNALGQTTSITAHTGGGSPLTIVDPNGVTTNLSYDARQRLLTSAV